MASLEFTTGAGVSGKYDRLIDAKSQILHGSADAAGEARLLPLMQFTLRIPFEVGCNMAKWALAPSGKARFAKVKLSLTQRDTGETHTWELQKAYVHRFEEIAFPADAQNATSQENMMVVVLRGVVTDGQDYDGENTLKMTRSQASSPAGELAKTGASIAADLTPVVGDVKAAQEMWSGTDLITGQHLSPMQRVISGASVLATVATLPFGGEGGELVRGAKDASKIAHGVGEATNIAKDVEKAEATAKILKEAEQVKSVERALMNSVERDAKIESLLKSTKEDDRFVGEAAAAVREDIQDMGRKYGPNGSVGEIDIETRQAIIEVTKQVSDKRKQIKARIENSEMNPTGKPVILYAPNYNITPAKDIEALGAVVVRSQQELQDVIKKLGGF